MFEVRILDLILYAFYIFVLCVTFILFFLFSPFQLFIIHLSMYYLKSEMAKTYKLEHCSFWFASNLALVNNRTEKTSFVAKRSKQFFLFLHHKNCRQSLLNGLTRDGVKFCPFIFFERARFDPCTSRRAIFHYHLGPICKKKQINKSEGNTPYFLQPSFRGI